MATLDKAKDWIKENAPMFSVLYENKYVGMAYDRFGSLPPKQQKQLILGVFGGVVGIAVLYIFFSYLSLWSTQGKASQAKEMVNLLRDYETQMRDKSADISKLDQNSSLGISGQLKAFLQDQARLASISPKMVDINEKGENSGGTDLGNPKREASVVLQRVNLSQLRTFMQGVEFGVFNISITDLRITNDDKLRGYMRAEMTLAALVPTPDAGAGSGGN